MEKKVINVKRKRSKSKSRSSEEREDDYDDETENKDIIKTDNEIALILTDYKRFTISKFKGKVMINIREYYLDNGVKKPGKKGITLTKENWEKIKQNISIIDEAIRNFK